MNNILKIIFFFSLFLLYYFTDCLNAFFKNFFDIKQISVILPIYNNEKYLKDCLNSIINQTLVNIEIICIDDGSTDNSSSILKKYSQLDQRLVIINQKNKGAGISRNEGIKISRGKFISFLDSDDIYYDNFALENLYNNAKKNKAIICGGEMVHTEENNNGSFSEKITFENEGFIMYKDYQYHFYYQRFIYNTNFLKINKLYFPNLRRFQDPPFFIKAMFKAKKFFAIKRIIYIYRLKPKKPFNLNQTLDMYHGIKECLQLAENMNLYKLYSTLISKLNSDYYMEIAKQFSEEINIKIIINKIIKSINKEIIIKNKLKINLTKLYENYNFSYIIV